MPLTESINSDICFDEANGAHNKHNNMLCRLCLKYYKNQNDLCSQCIIEEKYKDINLSIKDIIKLPTCDFKGRRMDENLEAIFKIYMKMKGDKFELIKSKS